MSVTFVDNSDEILRALGEACERGVERCGEKAVEYAKDLCPVDTGNLRNSITHTVEDGKKAIVGTPTEYAIYRKWERANTPMEAEAVPLRGNTRTRRESGIGQLATGRTRLLSRQSPIIREHTRTF